MSLRKEINFARGNKFRYHIAKMPILTAMAQTVDLGSLTLGEVEAYNPVHDLKYHGEKMKFGELDIGFLVDKNFDVYTEIYNYMNHAVGPYSIEETRTEIFTDITLTLYDNDSTDIVRKFIFENAFISMVGPISFDTTDAEDILSNVTFAFHSFRIEPTKVDTTGFTNDFNYEIENFPGDPFET